MPAGFFEEDPGRDRPTAPKARVLGGFEDMWGADRMTIVEDSSVARRTHAALLASDRFVPRFTMRVNF